VDWDGKEPTQAFRRFVIDITALIGPPPSAKEEVKQVEIERRAEEERKRAEVERKATEEAVARRKAEEWAKAEARRKVTEEAEARRKAEKEQEKEERERSSVQPSPQTPTPQIAQLEQMLTKQAEREFYPLTPTQRYIAQAAAGVFVSAFILVITRWASYGVSFDESLVVLVLEPLGLATGLVLANSLPSAQLAIKLLIIAAAPVVLSLLEMGLFVWGLFPRLPVFVVFAVTIAVAIKILKGRWPMQPSFLWVVAGGLIGGVLWVIGIKISYDSSYYTSANWIHTFEFGMTLGALIGFVESVAPAVPAEKKVSA
jgi:hypothetical protein